MRIRTVLSAALFTATAGLLAAPTAMAAGVQPSISVVNEFHDPIYPGDQVAGAAFCSDPGLSSTPIRSDVLHGSVDRAVLTTTSMKPNGEPETGAGGTAGDTDYAPLAVGGVGVLAAAGAGVVALRRKA
ncbi:hypothetical protein GCM10029964_001380 [Kibdelosporangium lantanae]